MCKREMSDSIEKVVEQIYNHCLGEYDPSLLLVSKGHLSEAWVDKYLVLLNEAYDIWGNEDLVPKKLIAAIHYASFYLEIRYQVWQEESGESNDATMELIGKLRTPSEVFILNVPNT